MGIDVRGLLAGADGAWQTQLAHEGEAQPGPAGAVWLGAALSALADGGRDKLTFVIAETLPGLGLWLEQLVAESTGKHGKGILPVAEEPLGDPAVYGADRVFAYLPDLGAPDPALDAARARARRRGPSADHDPHVRSRRPRPRLPAGRDRGRGRRLGAADQPLRPAQRPAGQGRDQARARGL